MRAEGRPRVGAGLFGLCSWGPLYWLGGGGQEFFWSLIGLAARGGRGQALRPTPDVDRLKPDGACKQANLCGGGRGGGLGRQPGRRLRPGQLGGVRRVLFRPGGGDGGMKIFAIMELSPRPWKLCNLDMAGFRERQAMQEHVMSRLRKCVFIAGFAIYALSSAACFSSRLESSNQYAPIDLADGQQVQRIVVDKSTVNIARFDYGWISQDGRTTWSDDVVTEIDNFLGTDTESSLIQIPADKASWFWSPRVETNSPHSAYGSDVLGFSRKDSIIILGLNPTVALRIERPTQFAYYVGLPWHDPRPYWGWGRFILSRGIADSLAVPVGRCDEPWPYATEIIIPSIGFRRSIDLIQGGDLAIESCRFEWECVNISPDRFGVVFDIHLRTED